MLTWSLMVKKIIVVFPVFCVSSFSSCGWQMPVPRSLRPVPPAVAHPIRLSIHHCSVVPYLENQKVHGLPLSLRSMADFVRLLFQHLDFARLPAHSTSH